MKERLEREENRQKLLPHPNTSNLFEIEIRFKINENVFHLLLASGQKFSSKNLRRSSVA